MRIFTSGLNCGFVICKAHRLICWSLISFICHVFLFLCSTKTHFSGTCQLTKGCSRNYLGGCKHFFVQSGEGVLLTMCLRGGGWRGNLSWGSRHIWSIVGRVNESTYMSWGSGGGSDSLCVLGVEGPEKNVPPPRGHISMALVSWLNIFLYILTFLSWV